MTIEGNKITATNGRILYIPKLDKSFTEYTCGTVLLPINGSLQSISISADDILEIYEINIDGIDYKVSGDTYNELVTNLIRLKYSLDAELALIANIRIGNTSDEEEFQNWRNYCKQLAKKLIK